LSRWSTIASRRIDTGNRVFALASGFNAHCSKPVRAIELVHVVQQLMANKETRHGHPLR
jgi:CheY-like chemotaxis protein